MGKDKPSTDPERTTLTTWGKKEMVVHTPRHKNMIDD